MNPAPHTARITTSWDDGHPLDFRLAEMLARHGLPGTFYIPRSASTGTMSAAQVRELSELSSRFEIGAHTINHVFLTETDDATTRREIVDSKAWVEDVTGRPCRMFCPPAGKFSARHLRWVREAGFAGMRTVELLSLDGPRAVDGLSVMPTTVHAFPHRAKSYVKNALRRRAWGNLWRYVTNGGSSWWELAESLLARDEHRRRVPPLGPLLGTGGDRPVATAGGRAATAGRSRPHRAGRDERGTVRRSDRTRPRIAPTHR